MIETRRVRIRDCIEVVPKVMKCNSIQHPDSVAMDCKQVTRGRRVLPKPEDIRMLNREVEIYCNINMPRPPVVIPYRDVTPQPQPEGV